MECEFDPARFGWKTKLFYVQGYLQVLGVLKSKCSFLENRNLEGIKTVFNLISKSLQ